MKRKLLLIILSVLFVFCFSMAFACNEGEEEQVGPVVVDEDVGSLEVSSSIVIEQYRTGHISVTVKEIDGTVSYVPDNSSIVSVDSNGVVHGLNIGQTDVTVSIGKYSAKCNVTVNESTASFVAKVDQGSVNLKENVEFNVNAYSLWDVTEVFGAEDGVIFTWESLDPTVATVTDKGNGKATIKGISAGDSGKTTVINLKAEFRGKTAYYPNGIAVSVNKFVPVIEIENYDAAKGGFGREIYLFEKTAGDGSTSAVPSVSVYYKENEITDYNIVWTKDESNAVSLNSETGEINALSFGESVLTATITFTPQGESEITAYISVRVNVVKANVDLGALEKAYVALNRNFAYTDDNYDGYYTVSGIGDDESAVALYVGGEKTHFVPELEGGVAKIPAKAFGYTGENYEIVIETDKKLYSATLDADVIDFAISDEKEFNGWYTSGNYAKNNLAKIVILADIDFGGKAIQGDASTVVNNYWWPSSGNLLFNGSIDGRGHVLSGFSTILGLLPGVGESGVVKNLACVNFVTTGSNAGLLGIYFKGNLSNCYFEGVQNATNGENKTDFTGFYSRINSAKAIVKNVVAIAHERTEHAAKFDGAFISTDSSNIIGLYVVNDNYNGKVSDNGEVEGVSVYSNGTLMMQDLKGKLPESFAKTANAPYWTLYDGMVLFNSQVVFDRYDALKRDTGEITVEIDQDNFEKDESTNNLLNIGDPVKLVEKNKLNCTWYVEGLNENAYSLVKGTIELTDKAVVGNTFTVKASFTKNGYFGFFDEVEIVVGTAVEREDLDGSSVSVAKNRLTGNISIEGVDPSATVKSVFIDGEKVDSEGVSNNEGTLTIPCSLFENSNSGEIKVTVKTDVKVYTTTIKVYDFAIGNKDEFYAWYNDYANNFNKELSIILTDDIDFEGENIQAIAKGTIVPYWYNSIISANPYFNGTFDGNYHTLSNFDTLVGFIPGVDTNGVIKNLSLVNMHTLQASVYSGLVGVSLKGTIENCYFEGSMATTKTDGSQRDYTGYFSSDQGKTVNVVVIAHDRNDYGKDLSGVYAYHNNQPTFNNMYVICDKYKEITTGGTVTSGIKIYSNAEEMGADISQLPEGFDAEYWTLYNGIIMIKSAVAYYEGVKDTLGELVITNPFSQEKVLSPDFPLTLSVNKENVIWTIEGLDASVYSFEGNVLTLNEKAVKDTEFSIIATVYAKSVIKFTAEITGVKVGEFVPYTELNDGKSIDVSLSATDFTVTGLGEGETFVELRVDNVSSGASLLNDGGSVVVPTSVFSKNGTHAVVILTESNKYRIYVNVCDYIISNETEFDTWLTAFNASTANEYDKYIVLSANITISATKTYSSSTKTFTGTFDGRGYFIKNLKTTKGLFNALNGTVKDVAIIDTVTTLPTVAFIGTTMGDNAVMSNVLYKGTQGTTAAVAKTEVVTGFYTTVSSKASIENVVVIVDRKTGVNSDPISQSVVNCSSLYVVVNASKGTTASETAHYYASETDLKTEITSVPKDFDAKIWAMDDGNLVFASMIEE